MKIIEAQYDKIDFGFSDIKVLVLKESEEYIEGLNISKLSDEEVKKLKEINDKYWEEMKSFFKVYRKYDKNKIISKKDINV
jgi:2-oxo-4-hydroxy-4-carboxy--5-ureidoimidazoline (OHCU) decarboxylase